MTTKFSLISLLYVFLFFPILTIAPGGMAPGGLLGTRHKPHKISNTRHDKLAEINTISCLCKLCECDSAITDCRNRNLKRVIEIGPVEPGHTVRFESNFFETLETSWFAGGNASYVYLTRNSIKFKNYDKFRICTNSTNSTLRVLDLANNQIDKINRFTFFGCVSLELLILSNNPLQYLSPDAFISAVSLTELDLSETKVTNLNFLWPFRRGSLTLHLGGDENRNLTLTEMMHVYHLAGLHMYTKPGFVLNCTCMTFLGNLTIVECGSFVHSRETWKYFMRHCGLAPYDSEDENECKKCITSLYEDPHTTKLKQEKTISDYDIDDEIDDAVLLTHRPYSVNVIITAGILVLVAISVAITRFVIVYIKKRRNFQI